MKWINVTKIYFLFIVGLLFSTPAFAGSKLETVYTKFSDQQIVDILKKEYNDVSILEKGKIVLESNAKHIIYNNRNNGSLSFRVYFSDNTSLAKLNEWNRDNRFISVYLDTDNEIVLKSDLDVEEGVSEAYLLDFVKRFVVGTMLFVSSQAK